MRVIANKRGYFGQLREAGEQFDVPDGSLAKWFEPVGASQKASSGQSGKGSGSKETGSQA